MTESSTCVKEKKTEVCFLKPGEGKKTRITGFDALYRTDTEVTGDLMDYFVLTVPSEGGAPLHIHHKNDETLFVLSGEFTFQVGDKVSQAPEGTFVFLPRGVPHKFTNVGKSEGRLIGTFTPAGTFEFFNALTKVDSNDFDEIVRLSKKYGHEVLEQGN